MIIQNTPSQLRGLIRQNALERLWLRHLDGDIHAQYIFQAAEVRPGQRRGLIGNAPHRDADEVLAADQAIGRVELDPSGARQIHLAPGVRRSTAEARRLVLAARHVYVAGDESSSYAEGADGLHHQHREVAAAAAAAVERQ